MNQALLITAVALLVLLLLLQFVVMSRLSRLERRVMVSSPENPPSRERERIPTKSDAASGLFEQFIAEDRSRLMLKKSEQSAAYREWRKQRGITWQSGDEAENS